MKLTGLCNYNVPDNYFDQLLESGKVVDGTMMYHEAAGCFYLPGQNHPYGDGAVDGDRNGDCLVHDHDKE